MRITAAAFALPLALVSVTSETAEPKRLFVAIGDSLGHGTMDATNNAWATANAFLGRMFYSLRTVESVTFNQPSYDFAENRLPPYTVPTNLSVDGADLFSIEGLEYGKRVGNSENLPSPSLLADHVSPADFADDYDKVSSPRTSSPGGRCPRWTPRSGWSTRPRPRSRSRRPFA